jgi:hypothetical protein
VRHGIVKVIPPAEWLANQPPLDDIVKTIRIKEPIAQDIMGSNGTYRQANILHGRSYNLPQWRQLCDQSEHQPPAKRGERRANADKPTKPAPKPRDASTPKGTAKKKAARPAKGKGKNVVLDSIEGTATPERLPTPESPSVKPEDKKVKIKKEVLGDDECLEKVKGGRQPKAISVSSRRKYSRREGSAAIDEEAFKGFDYELKGVDYSQERCDELERSYWKSLTYAPPLYGADMMGSLFDDRTTTWNLGKLDNILDVLGSKIPGVNTAYLYLGMWKATFAWHLEDVDLYSINYLHFGAPKQWYSISQGDARRFEAAMKTIWPADAKACDQFLRHKTFLISPSRLMENFNIKVNKIVHRPGEFVITFPYGYHSGYNLGYNCAEAVNFGLEAWLPYGRVAKKCDCSEAQDSVWIDVSAIDRKLRGEETEYEESEEEDDEDDEDEVDIISSGTPTAAGIKVATKIKAPQKKRKRPTNEKSDKISVKKIRIRVKGPTKEPCILCPNDIPSEPLLPTEDGRKAHRICALYIPETSIQDGENAVITDVKYIDKARMELKCNYCRSKKGACFQCSQKKCTRAYHATCAAAAGVFVEQGEIPVFGEDGTEYKDWGIEFSCRFHRAKRDHKKWDAETLDSNDRVIKAASALKVGDTCQMQYYRGDIFAGTVVENRRSEETLLLDVIPRGFVLSPVQCKASLTLNSERVEVQYKWLLIPEPSDFRLVKPSAKAIPMPKSFKDKESLNITKRLANDLPRKDDIFVEGCVWSEFTTEAIPFNAAQVKVDLSKEDQVWYYLGKTSTEARAQFTEHPSRPRHNPRGHFLDTIPKPVPNLVRQSYSASYPTGVKYTQTSTPRPNNQAFAPGSINASKSDKPYVYKPKVNPYSDGRYRVDPHAYQSQQSFVQQSQSTQQYHPQYQTQTNKVAYSFGTDPRWQVSDSKPSPSANQPSASPSWMNVPPVSAYSNQYTNPAHRAQTGPIRPPSSTVNNFPNVGSASHSSPYRPPQQTSTHSPIANGVGSSTSGQPQYAAQHATVSAASIPDKGTRLPASELSRPTSTSQSPTAVPLNPGQSQQRAPILPPNSSLKQNHPAKANNPFSGRAPSGKPNVFAKYPYLQREHNRSPLEYRTPYRPGGGFMNGYQGSIQDHWKKTLFQERMEAEASASNPYYDRKASYSSNQQQPMSFAQNSKPSYNSIYGSNNHQVQGHQSHQELGGQWNGRNPGQLHPAIRQDYNNIVPQEQRNSSSDPKQTQQQILQPPAMYNRHAIPQGQSQQQPQQTWQQSAQLANKNLSPPKSSGDTNSNLTPRPSQTPRQLANGHSGTVEGPKPYKTAILPPKATFKVSKSGVQHQVKSKEHNPTSSALGTTDQLKPHSGEPQPKTFTDVPSDSTSIIEKLMTNLRKAAESRAI